MDALLELPPDIMDIFNEEPSLIEPGVDEITRLFGEQDTAVPFERLDSIPDEERSRGLYDLHGVSDAVEETPELISKKLEEIDLELTLIHPKVAYEEAVRQSKDYVKSWRLRFLRAERFDAAKAATRMTRHFEKKQEFFGKDKAGRDITLKDLSPEEREALDTGYLQLLPQRDRGGRAIYVSFGQMQQEIDFEITLKLGFLLYTMASADEEVQKNGAVAIYYGLGQTDKKDHDRSLPIVHCMLALPVHLAGLHNCYDNPIAQFLVGLFSYALNAMYLSRLRTHSGNHTECQYSLMTFGIPIDSIPLKPDGSIDSTNHCNWLRSLEKDNLPSVTPDMAKSGSTSLVLIPGHKDVLMGRGQRKASGNRRFRKLLEEHRQKYDSACKFEKNVVAQMLFRLLVDSGTRFLKQTEAGWVQIEDELAIDKISHGFRNLRISSKFSTIKKE